MTLIKSAVLGIVAIIIVIVIIFIIRKVELAQALTNTGKFLGDSLKGITDFANSFDPNEANAKSIRVGDPNDEFFSTSKAPQKGFQDELGQLDPKSPTFSKDKKDVANKFGITGADEIEILENGGTKIVQNDKPDEKQDGFRIDDTSIFSDFYNYIANVFNPQQAFAEESPKEQTVIDARTDDNRPLNLNSFGTAKTVKGKTTPTTIQGFTTSELNQDQQFKVFGINENNQAVRGVIRETKQDPSKLKVDSKKMPTETASERASRVFEETGKFADEDRGFGVTKTNVKTANFKFGTNTSSGLKIPTTNREGQTFDTSSTQSRIEQLKEIQNQKALQVFNSGSISNF